MLEFTEDIGGSAEELTVASVNVMKAGMRVFRWREGDRGRGGQCFLGGSKWKADSVSNLSAV